MSAPLITVIIPICNAEKYLRECLDSVLGQTERNIEVICIDDGSVDSSGAILEEYRNRDGRLSVVHQRNAGGGAARNAGIERARGKYLSFFDADDFFEPRLLERASGALEESGADIAIYRSLTYNDVTSVSQEAYWTFVSENVPSNQPFSYKDMADKIFNTFANVPWNKMFRRTFIEDEGLRFQEIFRTNDLLFVCSALVLAKGIVTLDAPLAHYRIGMLTNCQATNSSFPLSFFDAFSALKEFLVERGMYQEVGESFLNHALDGVISNLGSQTSLLGAAEFYERREEMEQVLGILEQDPSLYRNRAQYDAYCDFMTQDKVDNLFSRLVAVTQERNSIREELVFLREERWRLSGEIAYLREEMRALKGSRTYKAGLVLGTPIRVLRSIARK